MKKRASKLLSRFYALLDQRVFPAVVTYATHPLVILLTILLLVPLIGDSTNTTLALVLGNYTNVVSASVSSIVLLHSLRQHTETKQMHAQHAQEIAKLHAKLDDAQGPKGPKGTARTTPLRTLTAATHATNPPPVKKAGKH